MVGPCTTQSAYGWNETEQLSQHASQRDASKGFGGKYGLEKDKQDKVFYKTTDKHRWYTVCLTSISKKHAEIL